MVCLLAMAIPVMFWLLYDLVQLCLSFSIFIRFINGLYLVVDPGERGLSRKKS